jgi:2-keto-4-pentenoate hydratase/2-oxohepta-3-ene-1,7-dioic acid hydratase in catechol pathway
LYIPSDLKNKKYKQMKIICIGRNYIDHITELRHKIPEQPLFFLKPDSSILLRNKPFFIPSFSQEIDYEVELVFKIGKLGKCIQEKYAHAYYDEIGLGVDFTARDLQRECIKNGQPWEKAKNFDGSAVISHFVKKEKFRDLHDIHFSLLKNGEKVQHGNSGKMIFHIDKIISFVSQFMTLKIGDLIFTGTPSGTGKVSIHDRLQGYVENELFFDFKIK